MIIRPKVVGDGRGLTAGGGSDSISSASESSSPSRVSIPGTYATTPGRSRPRSELKSRRIGRWRSDIRKSRIKPRECGSKVGIVSRNPRKYYGTYLRKRIVRKRKVRRSVLKIRSGSGKSRGESLRKYGNRKVMSNRILNSRIVTRRIASGNR